MVEIPVVNMISQACSRSEQERRYDLSCCTSELIRARTKRARRQDCFIVNLVQSTVALMRVIRAG